MGRSKEIRKDRETREEKGFDLREQRTELFGDFHSQVSMAGSRWP